MITWEVLNGLVGAEVRVTVPVMAALMVYPWPGGASELRQGLQVAWRRAGGGPIGWAHLPPDLAAALPQVPPGKVLQWFEDETKARFLAWAVRHSGLNKKELARELGTARGNLYKLLHRYGIDPGGG